MCDYTLVVAVDGKHLEQFKHTWPTWRKNKPSLLKHPMLVIYDGKQVTDQQVVDVIKHPNSIMLIDWSRHCARDYGNGTDKWYNPARYRMLSAFVHVPGHIVQTPYWLKMDTDAIASGMDDWIDPEWFESEPAIVCSPWGFTRPPDQMDLLDQWVKENPKLLELNRCAPLELHPKSGDDRVCHARIGSWCGFFRTDFTKYCSDWAVNTCGLGLLPVPSQDGYLWYCAKRLGLGIVRPKMKKRGWYIFSTMENVKKCSDEALR